MKTTLIEYLTIGTMIAIILAWLGTAAFVLWIVWKLLTHFGLI